MRIVLFSDGSEDGLRVLGTVAAFFDKAIDTEITLAAVTWPERRSRILGPGEHGVKRTVGPRGATSSSKAAEMDAEPAAALEGCIYR
jgi:hypothetical protein